MLMTLAQLCACCAVAAGFSRPADGRRASRSQATCNLNIFERSGGISGAVQRGGKVVVHAGITVPSVDIVARNRLSRDLIRLLINTHPQFDHTGGNPRLETEGLRS